MKIFLNFQVSHPTIDFDIGYIRFFRIVDTLRNKLLPSIIDLIKTLNLQINKEWVYAGRPCSPRVLFTFENCPKDILNDSEAKLTVS
jgi:protein SMG8